MDNEYDDNYGTCKETSASLRIMHQMLDPDDISKQLGITPSWAWRKGEQPNPKRRPSRIGIWALDTKDNVVSRDLRRHLDWLLDQVSDKIDVLNRFRQQGYRMDVFCLWVRSGGTGGPTLSPRNMGKLAALGLEIGFEFWSEDIEGDEDDKSDDEP